MNHRPGGPRSDDSRGLHTRARTRRGPPTLESGPSASDDACRGGGGQSMRERGGFVCFKPATVTLRVLGSPTSPSLAACFLEG